ncbi:MAG: dipeptidase [Bryobacteraceae bacterium]
MAVRIAIAALAVCAASLSGVRRVTDAEVMRVHRSALLIDTHNDLPENMIGGRKAATTLAGLQAGGVGAVFFAAYVSPSYGTRGGAARRALEMIDVIRQDIVARQPEGFELALSAVDIEAAHRRGKVAVLIGVEGGYAIEDSLRVLRCLYALGARYMTLTHMKPTNWADASGYEKPEPEVHHGLTRFGKEVVREMNRLGMLVDVSHVSDKTFWDVLGASSKPVFASHSSCRALADMPRNMTDEMIAAMAKKGGVIQINAGCGFLKRGARATVADVVAHIDHVVKIAGTGAVGIGTDFDGVECTPVGLEDVSKFPNLTRALLEKGYTPGDIRKIYGENLLRVMRSVEGKI